MKIMESKTLKIFFAFTLVLFLSDGLLAQNKKEDVETVTAEANRKVPESHRIAEMPTIIDTVIKHKETNYSLLSVNYRTKINVDTIQPAKIRVRDKLQQLYNSYVKIGIGYPLIPLADIYYNNGRSRDFFYGGRIQHLSGFSKIKHYAPASFDRTKINLYGGLRKTNWDLDGAVTGNFRGLHYYGIRDKEVAKDTIAQRFSEGGFTGHFATHKPTTSPLNFSLDLAYNYFADRKPKVDSLKAWHSQENYLNVAPKFWYQWKNYRLGLDLGVKYNGYRYGPKDDTLGLSAIDTAIKVNNVIANLMPNVAFSFFDKKLNVKAGVNLTYDAGIVNKFRVFPLVQASYSLLSNTLVPYFNLGGGIDQNSLRKMSYINEFVLSNQNLRNSINTFNVEVGVRGNITNQLGYSASFQYNHYNDYLLYEHDTLYFKDANHFRAIYDTANRIKLEGALYYQLNEKIKLDFIARYSPYKGRHEFTGWYLPVYQFVFRGSYNLFDKLLVQMDFDLQGGRSAKVYGPGKDIVELDNQFVKKLGFMYDINLHFEYRFTPRISAFLDLNNVAANQYKRWLNYPVYGIQVMAGATFRF